MVVDHFYSVNHFEKWKGFRVLAVDGSTLQLQGNHPSLKDRFSYHCFGPKADAGHWMSRISYLYDVFNGIVLDAQMMGYTTSESTLCDHHMPFVKKGDLLLFDRYYASFQRMFTLMGKGCHFVFRMKDNWWKCVEQFVETGLNEQIVELSLPAVHHGLLKKYPHLKSTLNVRLIKKVNRKGEVQVFCTSLIDEEKYSRKSILNLYKQRWGIEEAYKLIKCRLEVADFSGLTSWAIQQDFYAKTMLISLCNTFCFGIKPKPNKCKQADGNQEKEQRVPIINRTYALNQMKAILTRTAFHLDKLQEWIEKFLTRISRKIEWSRRNQSVSRIIKPNLKYAMSYKNV